MKKAAYEKPAVQKINLTSTERITASDCNTQMAVVVGSILSNNPGGDVTGISESTTTFFDSGAS